MTSFRHIFGPIASRRLGRSLGIDLVAAKHCPFDCLYCEVGRTTAHTDGRTHFFPVEEVLGEAEAFFAQGGGADVITITGSGEPTLSLDIGTVIDECKKRFGLPVAVITNGALLWREDVRRDLGRADIVMPSLDSGRDESFIALNRPVEGVTLQRYIAGLEAFRREFTGRVWVEVLFAQGVNDSDDDVEALAIALARIGPDRVQINTVVRPPADKAVQPVGRARLEEIAERLGRVVPTEIIAPASPSRARAEAGDIEPLVLETLKRRACTVEDLAGGLAVEGRMMRETLDRLVDAGRLQRLEYDGTVFYKAVDAPQ